MSSEYDDTVAACFEDIDYFIERFEDKANSHGGEKFVGPLGRLKELRGRVEGLIHQPYLDDLVEDIRRNTDYAVDGLRAELVNLKGKADPRAQAELHKKLDELAKASHVNSLLRKLDEIDNGNGSATAPAMPIIDLSPLQDANLNLGSQLHTAQATLDSLAQQFPSLQEIIFGLADRIETLESRSHPNVLMAPLSERLGSIESSLASLAETQSQLLANQQALSQQLESLSGQGAPAASAVTSTVNTVASAPAPAKSGTVGLDAKSLKSLQGLEARLDQLDAKLSRIDSGMKGLERGQAMSVASVGPSVSPEDISDERIALLAHQVNELEALLRNMMRELERHHSALPKSGNLPGGPHMKQAESRTRTKNRRSS